jgi:hypothetical protein
VLIVFIADRVYVCSFDPFGDVTDGRMEGCGHWKYMGEYASRSLEERTDFLARSRVDGIYKGLDDPCMVFQP